MIKIGEYTIRQYPIFSVDIFEPNFRYDIVKGEKVLRSNLTFDEAVSLIK